jgi:DNA-binding PadR family transcriptional regulator
VLQLLVLHLLGDGRSYGNRLIERIAELSEGLLVVNPNTMYPLLRDLEARGLVAGEWEHPERRSRRFYALTDEGAAERERLRTDVAPRLEAVVRAVGRLRDELA